MHKLASKVVAVALQPSEQLPIVLLGILKAGMTYLPIDLESPPQRTGYIIQETSPAIFIVENEGMS